MPDAPEATGTTPPTGPGVDLGVGVDVDGSPAETSDAPITDPLAALVAAAVLTVPGVIRLEPTLSTAGPQLLLRRDPADGVRLVERAGVVDVDVNLATAAACQARAVTHQVQARIADLIAARGCTTGAVTVSVLSIEPGTPATAAA